MTIQTFITIVMYWNADGGNASSSYNYSSLRNFSLDRLVRKVNQKARIEKKSVI